MTTSAPPGLVLPASMDSSLSESLLSPPPVPVPPPPIPPMVQAPIKDKPSDMGIKEITDKDSWMEVKKIIDARLLRAPFWPGPSKDLITTTENAVASAWGEEVIAYHCKPPVSDLFVEESRFDGKGFEMIACIDAHFNPSGAVDSLGYIIDLINIKQAPEESVVTPKAHFSHVFALLKWGEYPSIRLSKLVSCFAPSVPHTRPSFKNFTLAVTPFLRPASKRSSSSASHMTRILGRAPSAAMANQSAAHL